MPYALGDDGRPPAGDPLGAPWHTERLLGVMRGMGETMVVLMAAGEQPSPRSIFDSSVLTSTIAAEMDTCGSAHYGALFSLDPAAHDAGINVLSG